MSENMPVPSTIGATYVEPSPHEKLEPGHKLGDLFKRNMTQPYVLQRLGERSYWVQSFNYGTVFYVGDNGVLIFDTLEGVYDGIDFEFAFLNDMKDAVGKAIAAHPFTDFVDPNARSHTGFLANWSAAIAQDVADALRPKYGQLYGYEEAIIPNAEMVTWAVFEYR